MKMKKIWLAALALSVLSALTACGSKKQNAYQQGCEALRQGNYKEAMKGFQESVIREVKVADSQRGIGIAWLKLGDLDQAISSFEEALEGEDNKNFQKDVLSYKAVAEYEDGRMEAALASCEKIKEFGADASCYYMIGRIGLQLDQYDAAKSNFDMAAQEDPSYDMFMDIYQAYGEKDMDADGKAYLSKALSLTPANGADYYQRGRIYYFMGDAANAQSELLKAAEEGEDDARLFLGRVYLEQQDPASARAMYQEYAQEGGNGAGAYNGLALCDLAEGNPDGALENIAKGLEAAGGEDVQELLYNEVVAYEYKRDFATAKSKISEYLSHYPDDVDAKRESDFLQNR